MIKAIYSLSPKNLNSYRSKTFRLKQNLKLMSADDAAAFVKERGYVFFWPIKGIEFPSLWSAVAGERPVAEGHDDPGHVTWGWKDGALGKHIWYYGKILRKKSTMIDLDVAPYFYALSENYGDPEEDVLIAYQDGRLTQEAKLIFETLLDNGPLDTIAIRRSTRMTSKESNSRFERALSSLQADFKILPVGVSDAGAWHYAFIYDLTHRFYPDLPAQAKTIKEKNARQKLLNLYFQSVGAAQMSDLKKLFRWRQKDLEHAVNALVEDGLVKKDIKMRDNHSNWIGLTKLLD